METRRLLGASVEIVDENYQIVGAKLFESVRASRASEDRRAGANDCVLSIQGELAAPREHIINLVYLVPVISDRRTGMQSTFPEYELEIAFAREEGVRR